MENLYYEELEAMLEEGKISEKVSDIFEDIDKCKKVIATLTIVCGILIGICIAKHVEGNKKYRQGRDDGAITALRYANRVNGSKNRLGYAAVNKGKDRTEVFALLNKGEDGKYHFNTNRSVNVTSTNRSLNAYRKKVRNGKIRSDADRRFGDELISYNMDDEIEKESVRDYYDNEAFNDILYMIEAGSDKAEKLSFLKKMKSTLIDKRKDLTEIKKKAKSSDESVQKQAINDLMKLKKELKVDKSDLVKMTAQIAANNEKIKSLLLNC
jgi:hypothetical protein